MRCWHRSCWLSSITQTDSHFRPVSPEIAELSDHHKRFVDLCCNETIGFSAKFIRPRAKEIPPSNTFVNRSTCIVKSTASNIRVARAIYYVSLFETKGEEAEALSRQAIAMMRQTNPDDVNLTYMLQSLAHWIMRGEQKERNESRLAEAESMILEAKTLFTRHYGENHVSTITAGHSLALLARTRGDLETAERLSEGYLRRHKEADEGGYVTSGHSSI